MASDGGDAGHLQDGGVVIRLASSYRAVAALLLAVSLPVVWLLAVYLLAKPDQVSLFWKAEAQLATGAPYAPFLMVRDTTTREPIPGVTIAASLVPGREGSSPVALGEGVSDATGAVSGGAWQVPDVPPGDYSLVVEAKSGWGSVLDRVEREVKVVTAARLALAPDRAQARPGEMIRVRTLLVTEAGSKPLAGKPVVIDLLDPEGNRIGRAEEDSTEFGLAWAEFPLDSQAREGAYVVRAESDGAHASRAVQVKRYRLPPYRVSVAMDKPWYDNRERLSGCVSARTFDGHPVRGVSGEVRVVGAYASDSARLGIAFDDEGTARFSLPPGILVGWGNAATRIIEAALVDAAGRRASGSARAVIAGSAVVVCGIAEAGELVQGVENRVYLLARRPDGSPFRGTLVVTRDGARGPARAVETDERGVGVYVLDQPSSDEESLTVAYRTADGESPAGNVILRVRSLEREREWPGKPFGSLLLRTDRAVASAGDTLEVTALSSRSEGTVILCLRKDGRSLAASGASLVDGRAAARLTVPEGAAGRLSLEALLPLGDGAAWTTSRAVFVARESDLRVDASVDRPAFRPGETARLQFRVTDSAGAGVPAAVSVVALDEALLALTGAHPGLAQSLRASGIDLFRERRFPLSPADLAAEEGTSPSAQAALSSVRPWECWGAWDEVGNARRAGRLDDTSAGEILGAISRSDREDLSPEHVEYLAGKARDAGLWSELGPLFSFWQARSEEAVFDTAPGKLATHEKWREETRQRLRQLGLALLPVVSVLVVLAYVGHGGKRGPESAYRRSLLAVPVVTADLLLMGVVFVPIIGIERAGPFVIVLSAVAVFGHALALLCARAMRRAFVGENGSHTRLALAVAITDAFLLLFAWGYVTRAGDGGGEPFALLLLMCCLLAAGVQYGFSRPKREHGAALGGAVAAAVVAAIFAFLGFSYVVVSRARLVSTETIIPMEVAEMPLAEPEPDSDSSLLVRSYFPETLVFAPQVVTDERGRATLEVPVADSLTTWRVQADAIGARGGTSWTETKLVVTQPFSVDLVLPTDVTAGDLLYVPVVVSNHTPLPRAVEVSLKTTGATPTDDDTRMVRVPAKAVASAEFGVRFDAPGTASLEVTAVSGDAGDVNDEGDAVRRTLLVIPDGEPVGFAASSLVSDAGQLLVNVPESAIPGTITARLRLHRGPLSQMMDGLEGMLHEPYGCFEQTSSCTYPNVLVLQYLRATSASKPEIERKATDYIARGYQRLLGFEVGNRTGGFSLYGKSPASAWLTAYGLMEFTDMAEVYNVDPQLLARIRKWLVSQMTADGSFPISGRHGPGDLGVAGTAYAVWGLGADAPEASVKYLRDRLPEIEKEAYLAALVSNALVKKDRATASYLAGRLRGLATFGEERGGARSATLVSERTLAWGYGYTASAETTALGVLALLATGQDMELAQALTVSLQSNVRGGYGWGSTHATVLALKALVRTASVGRKAGPARVVVEVNGRPLAPVDLPAEETAVPASVPLDLPAGQSRVSLRVSGGPIAVRVSGQAYVPWSASSTTGDVGAADSALSASVSYSAKLVERNGTVLGTLAITVQDRAAEVPMVEWGMPAGFEPEPEDLDALKAKGVLSHWEISGRSLRLYLPDLAAGKGVTLPVRFYATAKGTLKGLAGRAYEYYRRHEAEAVEPATFGVF